MMDEEKSRKEKRKDSRAAKRDQRHLSRMQRHKTSCGEKFKPLDSNQELGRGESGNPTVSLKMRMTPIELKQKLKPLKPGRKKTVKKMKMKTKFEEYLEMDMGGGVVSVEEDLEQEEKLAKKLKLKKGKLRGVDDGLNSIFDGISSFLGSISDDDLLTGREKKNDASENVIRKERTKKRIALNDYGKVQDEVGDVAKDTEVEQMDCNSDLVEDGARENLPVIKGNAKYRPPPMRAQVGNELEEYSQRRRRIRGLLNRLSESNIESTTNDISEIFESGARSIGSQIIGEEILASISGGPRGNELYAAVFAAFATGITCLVGNDFSAKLIALLAKSFEDERMKEDGLSVRNITLFLCYLYVYGVCSSDLIFDFMFILSKRLEELEVSTILTVLQCCGMKLRGDDPAATKDFFLSLQNRVIELKSVSSNNKRMEFMLETICDIKNNKKRQEDPSHHTRIRKWLQKLRVEEILHRGLTWNKLLDPEKKGQWWVSGDVSATAAGIKQVAQKIDKELMEAQTLLQLAAEQRMNTDARRAIFCIIMSGEDYVDAFEKILRLDLPGKQDREIMRVLVECCLQEKVFNKYYTVLACKLCTHDKNHKFTLQYCLWDHFKDLESMELSRSMNLAKFVAEMLASFSLSLAALKSVDLSNPSQLTAKRVMHFRLLFEAVFEKPEKLIWNIFTRIAAAPELEDLRSGLEFFIKHYVVNSNKLLGPKFRVAKKALANMEGILM